MRGDELDVGYWLLDDELIDRDERRRGRVDDLEFEGGPGERTVLVNILCGTGAMRERLPRVLRPLAERLPDDVVRVPWKEVDDITIVVNLKRSGPELGLGRGDEVLAPLIGKLPLS